VHDSATSLEPNVVGASVVDDDDDDDDDVVESVKITSVADDEDVGRDIELVPSEELPTVESPAPPRSDDDEAALLLLLLLFCGTRSFATEDVVGSIEVDDEASVLP
jgi:hypothetical protein